MKISFDFDFTLSEPHVQILAEKLIKTGAEVWITTCRMDNKYGFEEWNLDLHSIARRLGIPENRIQITNGEDKWKYLKGFDLHFDDDIVEIELIKQNLPNCQCVMVLDKNMNF